MASSRAELGTRATRKNQSPHKSATPRSLSSEDMDDLGRSQLGEGPQTRNRKRVQDVDEPEDPKPDENAVDEVLDEEEEVTRCVCGQQEYPGAPVELLKAYQAKDSPMLASVNAADLQSEDVGSLFIQCDICKVWQHGGCVGIMDEATSPEEYFCEECRKDLHRLTVGVKGSVSALVVRHPPLEPLLTLLAQI